MKFRLFFIIFLMSFYGVNPLAAFANASPVSLTPVEKYSYCTVYGGTGHALGVVGEDWALTFDVSDEKFSGNVKTQKVHFYRGPDMYKYIGRPAGPRRPPIPDTDAYSQIVLEDINVEVIRIKIYDKVNGPIAVLIDDFKVSGQQFHVAGRATMNCFTPLP